MPATVTPIRYPGGKSKLYTYVHDLMQRNELIGGTYCEPFVGGAGLALKLLQKEDAGRIVINDADPAIYALWDTIIHRPQILCDFVENVELTVEEWDKQRNIYISCNELPNDELAKAAFYLNRTNVSGILKGGIIGGREQNGKYRMDARFNRKNLIEKIKKIATLSDKIEIHNLDVLDFIREVLPTIADNSLINFDPPYVNKGGQLYKNAFTEDDHKKLRDQIDLCSCKWIVTYDVCELISKLYSHHRSRLLDVNYTANTNRRAHEYVFFSDDLIIE